MSLPIDIATYISYGRICSYLAASDFSQKKLLRGGVLRTNLPQKLDVATNLVEWNYNRDATDETLVSTGNYLYQLCGKYIQQAKIILGAGGSGTIINPATGLLSTIQNIYLQFRVGVTSSPQVVNGVNVNIPNNGDTQITLPLTFVMNGSIAVIKDTNELPITDPLQLSFAPVYTNNDVTITLYPNTETFLDNDLYVITGLQFVTI